MLKWLVLSVAITAGGLPLSVAAQETAAAATAGVPADGNAAAKDPEALPPLVPETAARNTPGQEQETASPALPSIAPSAAGNTPAAAEAATETPAASDTIGIKKAAAPASLDATPSDASPDPLTPPEVAGPAPIAPGAPSVDKPRESAQPVAPANPIVEQIRAQLATMREPAAADAKEDFAALKAFYGERAGEPVWTGKDGLNGRATLAMTEIGKADDWGLNASAFDLPAPLQAQPSAEELAAADIKLSMAVMKYARHARGGRLDPPSLSASFDRKPSIYEPKSVMQAVAAASAADEYLRGLHPKFPQFERLRQALLALRNASGTGDISIPAGQNIKPGETNPQVALLRQRLKMPADSGKEMLYDDALVEVVKKIQRDRALKPTGIIDRSLRNALNGSASEAPAEKRWRLIANMERWRWMPEDLGDFYVWDSLPEQLTRVVDKGKVILTEKIVIGKTSSPTPTFTAKMQFVIFHPEWGVPDGIKTNEIGPQLRSSGGGFLFFGGGSSVLQRHGLRVYSNGREVDADSVDWSSVDIRRYQFIQPSGDRNVLGVVKFRFPNKHDVYMHDTPERHLFGNSPRAFSHGCMRVQNPVHLAEVILAHDKGWSAEKVRGMASSGGGSPNEITLSTQIPVHVVYFTAIPQEDGKVEYFSDIYGHDARVIAALKGNPMPTLVRDSDKETADEAPARPQQQGQQRRTRTVNKPWNPFAGFLD